METIGMKVFILAIMTINVLLVGCQCRLVKDVEKKSKKMMRELFFCAIIVKE